MMRKYQQKGEIKRKYGKRYGDGIGGVSTKGEIDLLANERPRRDCAIKNISRWKYNRKRNHHKSPGGLLRILKIHKMGKIFG